MSNTMPRPENQQQKGARVVVNNFEESQELRVEITGDSSTESGPILIFPSVLPAQTGYQSSSQLTKEKAMVKSSLGAGTFEEVMGYCNQVGFEVTKIRIQASGANGVDNFEGKLIMGDLKATGRTSPKDIELSDYRKEVGNGYNSVLEIGDQGMAVNGNSFLAISNVKPNTKLVLRFEISGVQRGVMSVAQ